MGAAAVHPSCVASLPLHSSPRMSAAHGLRTSNCFVHCEHRTWNAKREDHGAGCIPPGPVGRRRLAHSGGRRLSTVVDEAQVSALALLGLDAVRLDF